MFDRSLPLRRYLRDRFGREGSPLNLMVAIVLLSDNEDGRCRARASFLGQVIERAARTVRAALAQLRKLGFVLTRATGRALFCTPAWRALGIDPPEKARQSAANSASEPSATQDSTPAGGAAELCPQPETTESLAEAPQTPQTPEPSPHVEEKVIEAALAQVSARFGADAGRDVASVLAQGPKPAHAGARLALDRLLAVEPERLTRSAGAYFRRLLTLASTGNLAPAAACTPPPSRASEPTDDLVIAQAARVHTLKEQLFDATLDSERHRELTHDLNAATEALIRLQTTRAPERARPTPPPPPPSSPPPPRARSGPLPDWLGKFLVDQHDAVAAAHEAAAPT
jgi:hypothetical protein